MDRAVATKNDWEIQKMPWEKAKFTIKRHFTDDEISCLKMGNIPQEMEDKWFCYFEDGQLFAHRSWTGACIYIVKFDFEKDRHKVTVNRDKNQYTETSKTADAEKILRLLDKWSKPKYDYYREWLTETAEMLEKSRTEGENYD